MSHAIAHISLSFEGRCNTPRRFMEYLAEFNQGGDLQSLSEIFKDGFENTNPQDSQLIVQQSLPMRAICEHHLLPFYGTVSIGYIPVKKLAGLSKFPRLVEVAGLQRPTLQEILTDTIASVINNTLEPKGVIVVCRGTHTCMAVRGVAAPAAITTTSAVRGVFRDVPAARQEFFNIIGNRV